jgi:hypothetical protein
MLHAAGSHERQSHSSDESKRLHDLPRWENLSAHFLTLSESQAGLDRPFNVTDLFKLQKERCPTTTWKPTAETLRRPIIAVWRNESIRDLSDALGEIRGIRVRLCIEGEKQLQILGCGWRIVTCQFRGNKVLLHQNGKVATTTRKAFKALVAATRAIRNKRPRLRLVVSNPNPIIATAKAAYPDRIKAQEPMSGCAESGSSGRALLSLLMTQSRHSCSWNSQKKMSPSGVNPRGFP